MTGQRRRGDIPGIVSAIQPFAKRYAEATKSGRGLLQVIVDSGWTLTYAADAMSIAAARQRLSRDPEGWVLRARPPQEVAGSFDIQVEVLFYCTNFKDLQARTVETCRAFVDSDARASREVAFLVTSDDSGDEKIQQIPGSAGIVPMSWTWIASAANGGQGQKPLRARLEKFLYAQDLFDEQLPVVGARFFGRQDYLGQLTKFAQSDVHAGLFGLRKIGKTSLLQSFRQSVRDATDPPYVIAAYVDLQAVPFEQKDWRYLLWRIGRDFARGWQQSPASKHTKRFHPKYWGVSERPAGAGESADLLFDADFERLCDLVDRSGVEAHLLLILDEIELLLPPGGEERAFDGAVDFLRYFRGSAQEGRPISVFFAGANPYIAERAQLMGQENPLLNFVRKRYVAPFSEDETRRMVNGLGRRMGLRFQHEATALIFEQAGGHPYVTRQLCSAVLSALPRRRPYEVSVAEVSAIMDGFARSQHHTFEQVFESLSFYPDEQFLLRQLARGDELFVRQWARSEPRGIEHLMGYGLIAVSDHEIRLSIPLFRDYLTRTS